MKIYDIGRAALFIVIVALISFVGCSVTQSATINAASPSQPDVAAACALAVSGDTVVVPAGTNVWTSGLTLSQKAITLQGAGYYVYTSSSTLSNATGVETLIIDQVTSRAVPLINATWSGTGTNGFRLTGFHLKGTNTSDAQFGTVRFMGSLNTTGLSNSMFRIDHNYFDKLKGRPYIYAVAGVIDNNYIDQGGQAGIVFDGRIPDANQKGHWSWATDVPMGTVYEGVYLENNYFTNSILRGCTDGFAGARIVFRFNRTDNAAVENHGTESTGVYRGGRWMAIYGNTLNATLTAEWGTHYRSGTGVIFSNHVSGNFPGILRALNYRRRETYNPYKGASGTNVWDQNDATLYATGTHTGSSGTRVLTDSTATWTVDQWKGYALQNLNSVRYSMVNANTATTISTETAINNPISLTWTNGQTYEIRRIIHALDGVGMGKGDLLVGGSNIPVVPPTPTTWPNQVDDPIHLWANTGKTNVSNSGDTTIVNGRNYTNLVHATYVPMTFPHPWAGGTNPPPSDPDPPLIPDPPGPAKGRRRVVIIDEHFQPHSKIMELTNLLARLDTTNATETFIIPSERVASRLVDFTLLGGTNRGFFVWWKGE